MKVIIRGVEYDFPADMISRMNDDGTVTCRDCGNRLPPTESKRDRQVGILWSHQGIQCQVTEGWLSR